MRMYIIFWYPNLGVDCEKHKTYVLCNGLQEAWKIADKIFKEVCVAEVCSYASISGGREDWQEYWADYVFYNGEVITYSYYKSIVD